MMRKRDPILIMLIFLLMAILLNTARPVGCTSAPATIQVVPSASTVNEGTTFKVNVTVTNVTNLYAWEFGLYYLNTILSCVNVTEGPFLKQGGGTFWALIINDTYNATHGWILSGSSLMGHLAGVNGSGTLATVTFQAKAGGDTSLHFSNESTITFLEEQPGSIYLPYTTVDGTVHVIPTPLTHDIAVTNVTSPKRVIFQGFGGNITTTIANTGKYFENVNVTVYANMTSISNATIIGTFINFPLNNGTSADLTLTWNTTGFAKGNYTISAYAWPVPGETDTADNKFTGGWIMVSMVGDVTGGTPFVPDGTVDGRDISTVARSFGCIPGNLWWNANCDINNDGSVDGKDISTVAKHFGQADP